MTLDRGEYLEHARLLYESQKESTKSFDKAMLTLSAGALGLSITFLEKMNPQPENMWALFTAWFLLVFSLLSILFSFLVSISAFQRADDAWRKAYEEGNDGAADRDRTTLRMNRGVTILNWVSASFFALGVVALATFSVRNLQLSPKKGVPMADRERIEKGLTTPRPPAPPREPIGEGLNTPRPPAPPREPSAPPPKPNDKK